METSERATELLQEINDNQKRLLEQQTETLHLQREQLQALQRFAEQRDDSERYHPRGRSMMDNSRQLFLVIIVLLVVLLFSVSWVLFG